MEPSFKAASAPFGREFRQNPLLRLLRSGRNLVPRTWRPRLRDLAFAVRPLAFNRPSGIRIRVAGDADWTIYTEVFRKGEYDRAIDRALATLRGPRAMVVDLGANVGFFTLRVIEASRAMAPEIDMRIAAVEASSHNLEQFRSRVLGDNRLVRQVDAYGGLVGERSGSATITDALRHGETSLFRAGHRMGAAADVPYVDVTRLVASELTIDLLKCDIEGSELQFIRNYRDLLEKTQVAVFELHDDLCDTEVCLRLLRDYGFSGEEVLRHEGPYWLLCVWR